ncbi:MAG: hypothetical protein LBP76_00100 [Treponema sp.]|jgi:hypothetical protein|nr:hypothetical protein [Treponema sp.]
MELLFDSSELYVMDLGVRGCAVFGFDELKTALKKHGADIVKVNHWTQMGKGATLLVAGTTENRRIQMLLESAGTDYRLSPESLIVQRCDIPEGRALVLAGTDEKGLMYNLCSPGMGSTDICYGTGAFRRLSDAARYPAPRASLSLSCGKGRMNVFF